MSLDGIMFEGNALKLRRPKDYVPLPVEPVQHEKKYIPGIVSTNVADTTHKIFMGGIPAYLTDVRGVRGSVGDAEH